MGDFLAWLATTWALLAWLTAVCLLSGWVQKRYRIPTDRDREDKNEHQWWDHY